MLIYKVSYYINMNPVLEANLKEEDDGTGLAENSIWLIVKSIISKDGTSIVRKF
jgi:hypothetical protein